MRSKRSISQKNLDRIVAGIAGKKDIHGVVLHVASADNSISLGSAAGNIAVHTPYYIASINKMMLGALALRFSEKDTAFLSNPLARYFNSDVLSCLPAFHDAVSPAEINVWQLLTHTSGLPCYLLDTRPAEQPFMKRLLGGADESWSFEKVLRHVSSLKSKFAPGRPGRAYYSNTNFRLLGRILELEYGQSLPQLLHGLFAELEMKSSIVFQDDTQGLLPISAGKNTILPARYFASSGYDIYSIAGDQVKFLQAYFGGQIFPLGRMPELYRWNRIFFPLTYGAGLQRFAVPRLLSPFKYIPPMIGHSGSVGSLAFFIPEHKFFITGTVNQAAKVKFAFQAMARIAHAL